MAYKLEQYIWAFLRICLGWIFLWSFFDKVFGLGFSTASDKSWLLGTSPTFGFLQFGTHGPFSPLFQSLAGSAVVDWLFMLGLLLIGSALILGIGMKIASYSGVLMLLLMWLALIPPEHNPFLDEHIIYSAVLLGLATVNAGQWLGLGKWWSKTGLVNKYSILK
jgi:thiosulfate dehydrogenase (quinone) large subunit